MFTSDVALAMLEQMEDKSLFVKVRASWTLANLCDALVLEQQNNPDFDINEILSLELWCKVTAAAAGAANDNDKVSYRHHIVFLLATQLTICLIAQIKWCPSIGECYKDCTT